MVRKGDRGVYLKNECVYAEPDRFLDPEHEFIHIFEAPDATEEAFVHFALETTCDFWLYCMSDALTPRMFSDFNAEACVVLDREKFTSRLRRAWKGLGLDVGEVGFGSWYCRHRRENL